ncbi:hypothetical protein QBC42DRAFT_336107 [Cladorrhinum samala]|uniref:Hemerythrin-like domain-containing protein n=1 Tax=Cladorrhinum samala TaxID=585594 RepID=A0AAV9I117_9PEZI|nr:hypothetical protein QBC42DRAFT_336107 [Cladorrhinum samala]
MSESHPAAEPCAPEQLQKQTEDATTREPAPGPGPAPDATPSDPAAVPDVEPKPEPEPEAQLPPLTPEEFRVYNRLADQMDYFHNHFRSIHSTLYQACLSNRRPAGMSLKQFLDEGLRLVRYLEAHHSIEESHLYPLLARKMPQFKQGKKGKGKKEEECELLRQHQLIHEGMDEFEDYIRRCKKGEVEFEMGVMKEKMEGWEGVLMKHLDDEVAELGAETMRRYWSLEEMRRIPI